MMNSNPTDHKPLAEDADPPDSSRQRDIPRKVLVILTDTQPTWFVGAYGNGETCETPNLDRLARDGVRFDRAYTTCPLCTPARSALMTGTYPAMNGAVANETSPARHIPMIGERVKEAGVSYGYTGKWHLDGAGYHGAGMPGGGAPQEWWFDGTNYIDHIGRTRYAALAEAAGSGNASRLRELELQEDECWGYHVVERARDFFRTVSPDEDFLFVASFDEPHGPFICPPEYFELFQEHPIPAPPNHGAPQSDTRPSLQRRQTREYPVGTPGEYAAERVKHMACNAWLDVQIGRLLDAATEYHGEEVLIIFTSDHGDMHGSHGLRTKGAMMYEETVRIPLIMRLPRTMSRRGSTRSTVVSHIDLVPTILSFLRMPVPSGLPGCSLLGEIDRDTEDQPVVPEYRMIQFFRFGVFHRGLGEWFPIRCIVNTHWKLAINLFDDDEFYDLRADPLEECNLLLADSGVPTEADSALREMYHLLLMEMDRTFDPLRGPAWRSRPWSRPVPGDAATVDRSFFGEQEDDPPQL